MHRLLYWLSQIYCQKHWFGNYHAVPFPWLTHVTRLKTFQVLRCFWRFNWMRRTPFRFDLVAVSLAAICRFLQLHFANGARMNGKEQTDSQSVSQPDRRSRLNVSLLSFWWLDSLQAVCFEMGLQVIATHQWLRARKHLVFYMRWLRSSLLHSNIRSPRCELIIWPEAAE